MREKAVEVPFWVLVSLLTTLLFAVLNPSSSPGNIAAGRLSLGEESDTALVEEMEKLVEISIDDGGILIKEYAPGKETIRVEKFKHSQKSYERTKQLAKQQKVRRKEFDKDLDFTFERVNGWIMAVKGEYRPNEDAYPFVDLWTGYSFGREAWEYDTGFEQPILWGRHLSSGAKIYRKTDTFDDMVSDNENLFYALFVKKDFRDYFLRDGYSAYAKLSFFHNTIASEYRNDYYGSLFKTTDSSLMSKKKVFRENWEIGDTTFTIEEGTMKSLVLSYEYKMPEKMDEESRDPGQWYRFEWEEAGHNYGGDFSFDRYLADLRTYLRLSPRQSLSTRTKIGGNPRGNLPIQKQFFLGGIGTLRAHSFKEFRGNEMLLFNVEYGVDVASFSVLFFGDAGKSWMGKNDFGNQRLAFDAGVGLVKGDNGIYFARNMRVENSPIVISFRFSRTF